MANPRSLDEIEEDISSIKDDLNGGCFEYLPISEVDRSQIMLESALAQWVLTKLTLTKKSMPGGELLINDFPTFSHASSGFLGAVAALQSSDSGLFSNRRLAALFKESFFKKQSEWPDLVVSDSAFLMCVDTYSKGLPPQLYRDSSPELLTDWDGFRYVIGQLLGSIVSDVSPNKNITLRLDAISSIFYELFKNTHDHARTGINGETIKDSRRALFSRYYSKTQLVELLRNKDKGRFNQAESHVASLLGIYSESRIPPLSPRSVVGIVELSVMDSGPGMAAKWLGRNTEDGNVQDEFSAVMECFGKGQSTVAGGGRGFGLWKVLQHLKSMDGLIRVRTNRVHAVRQFSSLRHVGSDIQPEMIERPKEALYDWRRGFGQTQSEYPLMRGTLVSILVPVEDV